jgi:hypothetical protein
LRGVLAGQVVGSSGGCCAVFFFFRDEFRGGKTGTSVYVLRFWLGFCGLGRLFGHFLSPFLVVLSSYAYKLRIMPRSSIWFSDKEKKTLQRAAKLCHLKYQTFLKAAGLRAAESVIKRKGTLVSGRVFEVLEDKKQ